MNIKVIKGHKDLYYIEDLDRFLRQFNRLNALLLIGKMSVTLFNSSKKFPEYKNNEVVSQWGLGFIAYRCLISGDDYKSAEADKAALIKANHIYNGLNEPFTADKDLASFLFRLSQEQFPFQELRFLDLWSRYYWIFTSRSYFSIFFTEAVGLSFEEYFTIGFCIVALSIAGDRKYPAFRIEQLFYAEKEGYLKTVLNESSIRKFLVTISADYSKISKESSALSSLIPYEYKRYDLNPLSRYPIIATNSKKFPYVVPNIPFLIKKVAQGGYWDLRDFDNNNGSQKFINEFGEAFEEYCGVILKDYFGDSKVKNLRDIIDKAGNTPKHADWLVSEGENIYIFECKSALFPLVARQMAEVTTLRKWAQNNLIDAIDQLDNTEKILSANNFLSNKSVYKFVLMLEDFHLVEAPEFKVPVLNEAKKLGIDGRNLYLMRIAELEVMESHIKKYSLKKLLEQKEKMDVDPDTSRGKDFLHACGELDSTIGKKVSKRLRDLHDEMIRKFTSA